MQEGNIIRIGSGCSQTNDGKHHVEDHCRMCGQSVGLDEIAMTSSKNVRPVLCVGGSRDGCTLMLPKDQAFYNFTVYQPLTAVADCNHQHQRETIKVETYQLRTLRMDSSYVELMVLVQIRTDDLMQQFVNVLSNNGIRAN